MLAAALLLLLAGTWWSRRDETRGLNTREEMVATLLRFVPPGTPVDRAQQYMESGGIGCSRLVYRDWVQWADEGGEARVTRQGINYVY